MNFQRGRDKEPLEINLVPMIDVMLVILIFLMITTTYSKYTELQINLPTAEADKQLERANEVQVMVDAQGQYVVNGAPVVYVSLEQFAAELKRASGTAAEPVVVVSADATVNYQAVMRVMEAARAAGLGHISFSAQASR